MDGFLIQAMRRLNRLDAAELERIERAFAQSMDAAYRIFDGEAFRKRFSAESARMPINKALFETLSVNLATLAEPERERLVQKKQSVQGDFMALCADRQFEAAISQGTSDVAKVNRRFEAVFKMLLKVVSDA